MATDKRAIRIAIAGSVMCLAFGVLAPSTFGEDEQAAFDSRPYIPDGAVQVTDSVKTCASQDDIQFYEQSFQTKLLGNGQEFDLKLIGQVDGDSTEPHGPPLVWLYYDDSRQIADAFLTFPGKPIERLSSLELKRRWRNVCVMIQDLQERMRAWT